jgi:G3E family GTPase
MKIAVITGYWKNSLGGGVTTYLTNLVTEFKNRKLEVNVISKFGSCTEMSQEV